MPTELPTQLQTAIQSLTRLQDYPNYLAAFVFGSTARGEVTPHSDIDVKVVVLDTKTCDSVSHPFINGVKLDISFQTFAELTKFTQEEIQTAKRIPMLAESIVLFDKTGQLAQLKQTALKAAPKKLSKRKHIWIQFMIYHASNKAKRHLQSDPFSALYSLHSNIGEILKFHYQLNRRWWVSDKRLLTDILSWDPKLGALLKKFLTVIQADKKYLIWEKIIRHILKPLGGPKPISEINCSCRICHRHLKNLTKTTQLL